MAAPLSNVPSGAFPPRRTGGRRRRRWTLALGLAVLVAGGIGIWEGGLLPIPRPSPVSTASTCVPPDAAPASIAIPLTINASDARSAARVGVLVQVAAVSFSPGAGGASLTFPSMAVLLPLASGGSSTLTLPAVVVSLAGYGWTEVGPSNRSWPMAGNTTLAAGLDALLTSRRSAVMADVPYGALELEVRWAISRWNGSGAPAGSTPWSTVSTRATGGGLPSEFTPAPWVGFYGPVEPTSSAIEFNLTGAVSGTEFRLVLEYPSNGTEIESFWVATPAGANTFAASLPLPGPPHALPGGSYLVHVHDRCEAIVRMATVALTA